MKTDTKTLIATMRKVADGHTVRDCLDREAADRLEELERELAAERALADKLASVLRTYNYDLLAGEMIQFVPEHDVALAAWKEARRV
jgi:hypothetical protein